MAATLELRFDPSGGLPIAEIGLGSTHGGHRDNAIRLTTPCGSIDELLEEIRLLRQELDKIEIEAKNKFTSALQQK